MEHFGTKMSFNANKKIQSLTDVDGTALTFSYSGDNLSSVRDAFNRTLTFSSTSGRINSVSDSSSPTRSVSYGYDTNGNLTGNRGRVHITL